MVSKNQIKLIQSLQQKKYRNSHNLFVVEGEKSVNEFLKAQFKLKSLFYTKDFLGENLDKNALLITDKELARISFLKTPQKVLALFYKPIALAPKKNKLTLVLDSIQDPGNLGTIIRLCDWFNVSQLVCSNDTVDCYNPKVVQATMGSLARIPIIYTDILTFLKTSNKTCYAADMSGANIYTTPLENEAILVMGNEGNGLSKEVLKHIDKSLTIPRFNNTQKPESLNVATATAILLSEFNRITQM